MATRNPGGFKFDFGSTVTVLTSVAGEDYGKNINSLGTFTGVVLDETHIKIKRDTKHISISMDGIEELQDGCDSGYSDDSEGYDSECDEECCEWHGSEDECDYEENDHCEVKKPGRFLVLSLTCPSFPFSPGQIVWINIDQIVAFAVVCRN